METFLFVVVCEKFQRAIKGARGDKTVGQWASGWMAETTREYATTAEEALGKARQFWAKSKVRNLRVTGFFRPIPGKGFADFQKI